MLYVEKFNRGLQGTSSPWQKYDPPLRGLSPFFAPS